MHMGTFLAWLLSPDSTVMCMPKRRLWSHKRENWLLWPPQLLVSPHLALSACSSLHHVYICIQNLPLHRHLKLAAIAEFVHITGSGHNFCLPRSLPWTWRCWGYQQPLLSLKTPSNALPRPHRCWCCGSQQPETKSHHSPRDWCCHMLLHLAPWNKRFRVTACASMPPPLRESLPLLMSIYRVWKICQLKLSNQRSKNHEKERKDWWGTFKRYNEHIIGIPDG